MSIVMLVFFFVKFETYGSLLYYYFHTKKKESEIINFDKFVVVMNIFY
jgi:hypothetical protein